MEQVLDPWVRTINAFKDIRKNNREKAPFFSDL